MKDDVQNSQAGENISLRQALRAILDEGEQNVPSTTANIMDSIRHEQQAAQKEVENENAHTTPLPVPMVHDERPQSKRSRRTLYNILALTAVAVVLIASFGLFSTVLYKGSYSSVSTSGGASSANGSVNDTTRNPSSIPATTDTWSAVIITYKMNGVNFIANYNPLASASKTLLSLPTADVTVHGVSHNGSEVLFSVYNGSKTSYYIYPQAVADAVFTTTDRSSSAIWSTDDNFLFISTSKGVMSVNVQTYAARLAFPTLPNVSLLSYREDGYLYFIKGGQPYATQGTLSRINGSLVDTQQITPCPNGANFWLSPSETSVYYSCPDLHAGTLYAVNSDGKDPHIFRSHAGEIIGYAEDESPLTLDNVNGNYQVTRRGVKMEQNIVLVQDVAPEASMVTSENVAVAPYGHTLVAKGIYSKNGQPNEERLWYSNVDTGKTQAFALPQGANSSQLIGWDKLRVP